MRRRGFRVALVLAAVLYVGAASFNFVGEWLLRSPTAESLARGVRWNAGNPMLWSAYARHWLFAPEGFEPRRAAEAYLRAAALNPFDPMNWAGLATAYEQMGELKKAELALRSELGATPRSAQAAWRLANQLLLQGRLEEALPYLRVAAASDANMRPAVFDVGWKILAEPESVLRKVVPPGEDALSDYLLFLQSKKKLVEAYDVWKELRKTHSPTAVKAGYGYVEILGAAGMGREASRVWDELLEETGRTSTKPPGDLVSNGDFEADPLNAGLDWHISYKGAGFEVALDNFVLQHGSRSLRVSFDGSGNYFFNGVWQWIPVEPNRDYRFSAYMKTANVTSDSGFRICLVTVASPPGETFTQCTTNRIGTDPWTEEELAVRTGPNTGILALELRRLQSQKLNNRIGGTVWIDNVSLRPLAK